MSSTRTKDKCSPQEWAEVKKKAKADLEFRLAHGLPHSDRPLEPVKGSATGQAGDGKPAKPPRKTRPKKAADAK